MMRRKKDPPESSRANRRANHNRDFEPVAVFVPWLRRGVNLQARQGDSLSVWAAKLSLAWSARLVAKGKGRASDKLLRDAQSLRGECAENDGAEA